jgi:hypothetical protein
MISERTHMRLDRARNLRDEIGMKTEPSRDEVDRARAALQTHCYTCGGTLSGWGFECHKCHERQCSKACLEKHQRDMDRLNGE